MNIFSVKSLRILCQHLLNRFANAINTYLFSGLRMTSAGDQISDVQFIEKSVIQLKHKKKIKHCGLLRSH